MKVFSFRYWDLKIVLAVLPTNECLNSQLDGNALEDLPLQAESKVIP